MQVKHLNRSRWWYLIATLAWLMAAALLLKDAARLYWGPLESDLTNQFYPWRVFIHRWFERGVLPFWDPHIFSGYPTVETQQMLNLNPIHLLTIFLPPHWGLAVLTVVNTGLAVAGMVWGLRRYAGLSAMSAALGAVLYAFGALFALRVMAGHFTVVAAMAWWPVAALTLLPLTRTVSDEWLRRCGQTQAARLLAGWTILRGSPRARRLIAVSAVAHAMVCLAGAPQYIVYLFYIDLAVVAAAVRRPAHLMPALTLTGLAWVLALLVSAPQWLPALWYLPYSGRALSSDGTTGWMLGPLHNLFLELIMPFPFGDDLTTGHLHFKNVWETGTYPGIVALMLTLGLAVRWIGWRMGRRKQGDSGGTASMAPIPVAGVAALLIIVLGCYMMAGGWLPGFGGFREPLKARALLAFGCALGSSVVLESVWRAPRGWRLALVVAAVALGAALVSAGKYANPAAFVELIQSFGQPMDPLAGPAFQTALEYPEPFIADFQWSRMAAAGALALATMAALALSGRSGGRRSGATACAACVIAVLAMADVLAHHHEAWRGRHAWQDADLPGEIREYFTPRLAEVNDGDEVPWRVLLAPGIINRSHHMDGLYEALGYDPLMPAHGAGRSLIKGISAAPEADRDANRLYARGATGIRYQATEWLPNAERGGAFGDSVTIIPEGRLIEVTRRVRAESPGENVFGPDLAGYHYVLPAEMGGRIAEVAPAPADFRERIARDFDAADAGTTASVASVATGRPDEFAVRVVSQAPQFVVLKTTWLPGWRVLIDGKDAGRALFANNWMPAAIAPAGESVVTFRYSPVAWVASLVLCGAGCLLLVGCFVSGRRQQRRRHPHHAESA